MSSLMRQRRRKVHRGPYYLGGRALASARQKASAIHKDRDYRKPMVTQQRLAPVAVLHKQDPFLPGGVTLSFDRCNLV